MANAPKNNRIERTAADQKLIAGLAKHATTLPSIVIAGISVSTADITSKLKARIASTQGVETARATWQSLVQADRSEQATTETFVSGVRQALLVAFAGQVDALADFGLAPRKRTPLTPEEKVARTAKALATRAARHTVGPKKKASIKGTVSPAVPATAAPSAATPPQTPPATQPTAAAAATAATPVVATPPASPPTPVTAPVTPVTAAPSPTHGT